MDAHIRLFVYGTLKSGHVRHGLLQPASFLGQASTVLPHRLLDCGGYPGLVEASEDHAYRVVGELYSLTQNLLADLDVYEGVTQKEYERRELEVELDDPNGKPGQKLIAQAYFYLNDLSILNDVGPVWTVSNERPLT